MIFRADVTSAARSAALAVLFAACGGREAVEPGAGAADHALAIAVTRRDAAPKDTIAVFLRSAPDGMPIASWQGRLRFDPSTLEFVGQPARADHLVMVNDALAGQGQLRLLALDVRGLDSVFAELRFAVRRRGYTDGLAFDVEEGVTTGQRVVPRADVARAIGVLPASAIGAPSRRLSAADWVTMLGYDDDRRVRAAYYPGDGLIYGDATLNGVITGADVVGIANLAVGNLPMLTHPNRDYVVAANVAPTNQPGIGGPDDPIPPGRNPDGSYVITGADAVLVANEAVGTDQVVAGELIPGRTIATNRAIVSGPIHASRTFYRDTVYELHGTVIVGDSLVPDVTLTIQSGTRIEGDAASRGALVIRRGANIDAQGTRLLPIVFTCTTPVAEPGCWGGVTINGFGVLNNGDPDADGTVVGLPTKEGPGCTGRYGGNLTADNSGILRYVRIEFAGKPATGTGALPALSLLGVGSGTQIDSLQVYASRGDGVMVSGGTAQFRYVRITESGAVGLRWNDGWRGKAQFLIVEQGATGGDGILGSNANMLNYATPRSAPRLANVTVVGPGLQGNVKANVRFFNGSAGVIQNALLLWTAGYHIDIRGLASCSLGHDSLDLRTSIVFPNGSLANDADDCLGELQGFDPPEHGIRNADPLLSAPNDLHSPDYRPLGGSPALTGSSPPPADLFFDLTALYLGAVAPANLSGSNIPWYAGWTRGR